MKARIGRFQISLQVILPKNNDKMPRSLRKIISFCLKLGLLELSLKIKFSQFSIIYSALIS